MTDRASKLSLNEIFKNLSEIPFHHKNQDDALKKITELGKQVIDSHTFALAFINPETKIITKVVCTSNNHNLEETINNQKTLWDKITTSRQGKLHSEIIEKYHLQESYSCPLWSQESKIVGYIYHFPTQLKTLTKQEQGLLKSFANRAIVTIENLDYYSTFNPITLCNLSEGLRTASPDEFIKQLPKTACELFSASACILWRKDSEQKKFKILATDGEVDEDYQKLELDQNFKLVQKLCLQKGVLYLPDIDKTSNKFLHYSEVKKRGWVSILSAPLMVDREIIGILDIFTKGDRHFTELEKKQFECFSNFAELSFEKAITNQKTSENDQDREKLQKLTKIMQDMISDADTDSIFESLLYGALELVDLGENSQKDSLIGEISRLDYLTGELKIKYQNKDKKQNPALKLGTGITGKALKDKQTIRANDLSSPKWQNTYVKYWEEAQSEIAVPIFIENIQVRKGTEVDLGFKLIGVLNIESLEINAFSKADEKYLSLLASYAAVLIDRRESDEKFTNLRIRERKIDRYQPLDQIMENVIESITKVLQFETVNISMVDFETKRIKTEYIRGIPEELIEEFKKEADHELDSNDIQASIVRNPKTEVPEINDKRFDEKVFKKYGHIDFIRVFIPMIEPSSNRVIGTLEAGYKREYRNYIYERDVQILESFVDYVVHALEHKKSGIIDRVAHEFRSPIVGIRSNASFVQRRMKEITQDLIDIKLTDILTDCEILVHQVAELEYVMKGRSSQRAKKEETRIFIDVIIKTIYQLRPIITEHNFSINNIESSKVSYRFKKFIILTDKVKLSQVIYNLLINSIKYAKDAPHQFKIVIDISENNKDLIVKFKDWGIGIDEKYKKDIFEEGFRCPEAKQKNVTGSGLGLAISKSIMKELGGDLILCNYSEPTEFHLFIPKQ